MLGSTTDILDTGIEVHVGPKSKRQAAEDAFSKATTKSDPAIREQFKLDYIKKQAAKTDFVKIIIASSAGALVGILIRVMFAKAIEEAVQNWKAKRAARKTGTS